MFYKNSRPHNLLYFNGDYEPPEVFAPSRFRFAWAGSEKLKRVGEAKLECVRAIAFLRLRMRRDGAPDGRQERAMQAEGKECRPSRPLLSSPVHGSASETFDFVFATSNDALSR